jgi:hypothetical protein
MSSLEGLSPEALAREYAALSWDDVLERAAHASAAHDRGERAKRLDALERSSSDADRYAAALVRRWDAAKD